MALSVSVGLGVLSELLEDEVSELVSPKGSGTLTGPGGAALFAPRDSPAESGPAPPPWNMAGARPGCVIIRGGCGQGSQPFVQLALLT